MKEKIAITELKMRGFNWDGGQWISSKSGFFYGRGDNAYECAISTLESVGFYWDSDNKEWIEPNVLNDDFSFKDSKIMIYDVILALTIFLFFAMIVYNI